MILKFRYGILFALTMAALLLAGCLGGGSGTSPTDNQVSGTLFLEGGLTGDAVLTVGLDQYMDEQVEMATTDLDAEGEYQITVPDGTYTLWVSGWGVTAVRKNVVVNNDVLDLDIDLERFAVSVVDTTFDSSTDAPATINLTGLDIPAGADFHLLDSNFDNPVSVVLVLDEVEVPATAVETDVNMFLRIEDGPNTYYYPVSFEDTAPII